MVINVIYHGGSWAVKRRGASRASFLCLDKWDAVSRALRMSRNGDTVFLHERDGSVRSAFVVRSG